LQELATLLHRVALAQIVPSAIDEDMPERTRLIELARMFSPEDVQLFYQIAINGREDLSRAPDEYAGFTMTLMRMLAFMPEDPSMGMAITSGNIPEACPSSSTGNGGVLREDPSDAENKNIPSKAQVGVNSTAAHIAGVAAFEESAETRARSSNPIRSSNSAGTLDSDRWLALTNQLKLSGMPKMLAQHSEVKYFSPEEIELCVPEIQRHLMDKSYQDRLQAALREHLGKPVRLKVSVGVITGMSLAELENREKQERQSQANAAIESDPFVRELIENFDAKLIVSSIKPIQ
jgi:DNA polymerase-3 subunit gamma/tau